MDRSGVRGDHPTHTRGGARDGWTGERDASPRRGPPGGEDGRLEDPTAQERHESGVCLVEDYSKGSGECRRVGEVGSQCLPYTTVDPGLVFCL